MEILVHPEDEWRECPNCGLLCELPPRHPGLVADCPRCGEVLWRMRGHRLSLPLGYAAAALFFYLFALVAPFLEIQAYGRFALARLETGPVQLTAQGFGLAGALVFIVTLVAPAAKLGLLITILGGIRVLPPGLLKLLFRWYHILAPWAMLDVYLLGFLVAYTRLAMMASVHLDTALYALVGCMLCMAAADGSFDTEQIWRALDRRAATDRRAGATRMGCHACGFVNTAAPGDDCRRCGAHLHPRKPESVSRAWALLLSALALYVPANIYPFMVITKLSRTSGYTITDGIIELAQSGLWPLALLVFFASVAIPLMKIIALAYMLITVHMGSTSHLRFRTSTYRVIDFIGRWSMIDVFMVSILVALMQFDQFVNVRADIGAVCFGAVVVLTIFAVEAFDPRLMWDAQSRSLNER